MNLRGRVRRSPRAYLGNHAKSLLLIAGMTSGLGLVGCEGENTYAPPPPPNVSVAEPIIRDVTEYLDFTGTLEASARVDVRARVPGVLKSMHFTPGTTVNKGDLLFVIDPDKYEADVEAAEADLARAEARQVEAARTLERATALIKRGNIARSKVDEAEADAKSAAADILIRKAKLRQARINLGYTRITAPVTGRVGRNLVDIGNLVGEGEATALTDVTKPDPIYAYFNLNERDLLHVMQMFRERVKEQGIDPKKESSAEAKLNVELGLANENGFPHKGTFDFAESRVDPTTGTLQLRATFENKETPPVLVAGLFVRVRMPIAKRTGMPLVTERAVGFDQTGQFIYAVDANDVVEKRVVKLGQLIDGLRVVESGVRQVDRIVVNGVQRARPGGKVTPTTVKMSSFAASRISAQATKEEKKKEASAEPASSSDKKEMGQ